MHGSLPFLGAPLIAGWATIPPPSKPPPQSQPAAAVATDLGGGC